jgi:DNA-binding CsgD family transcriptional regulator
MKMASIIARPATSRGSQGRSAPAIPNSHPGFPAFDEALDLSPREYEIARLVANGYPNKTVAAILELSPWTVSTYLRRIYAKLGVRCRAAMVAQLYQRQRRN